MKKYLLALVAVMGITMLMAQEATKTLYIVDGRVVSKADFDTMNPDEIQNVDIFKKIEGAVVVTTKASKQSPEALRVISVDKKSGGKSELKSTTVHIDKQDGSATVEENDEKVLVIGGKSRVVTVSKTTEVSNPLILLKKKDGEIEVLPSDAIKKMDPHTIQAISVLKDKTAYEAYTQYGDVTNGVIVIELKELPETKGKIGNITVK